MKKRIVSIVMCIFLLLSVLSATAVFAESSEDTVTILFENDVHCAVDGYSKLKAYKEELLKTNSYVGVVSSGDYVQGSSLGAISQGEYMVEAMNLVGYDALALGNHEFDFKLARLTELYAEMNTKPVCANFRSIADDKNVFEPYTMVSYGDIDVAYIGVTTPETLNSSAPSQFKDENGNYTYTFSSDNLYSTVQEYIDDAKAKGADYIIGLTHLGTENVYEQWSAQTLVKNTRGFDVLLDGHSHSVVEGMNVTDKSGEEVLIASTGTKFQYIGKLTIDNGNLETELIPVSEITATDAEVDAYIRKINEEYAELAKRKIGVSEVLLRDYDDEGNRLIRNTQTNLGDFCADAFRLVMDADVGLMNGGGIRDSIKPGDVTFNDLISVYPWNNLVCVSEVTGQQLADLLEHCMRFYPVEAGVYQQVSGLTFTLKAYIPTPVVVDNDNNFIKVEGERRVSDIKVLNKETGEYEPIDLEKTYTVASHAYLLSDHGEGTTMLEGSRIISNTGMLDVELLEEYIVDCLGGVIGEDYAESRGRVTVLEEAPTTVPEETEPATAATEATAATDSESQKDTNPDEKPDIPATDNINSMGIWYISVSGIVLLAVIIFLAGKKRES